MSPTGSPNQMPKPYGIPRDQITVGIPRAMLFYKYEKLWTTFFNELGIAYVLSPETNKEIVTIGTNLAVDEACLPTKIFLGHVAYLRDKCNVMLIPRVEFIGRHIQCTKFMCLYDLVANTFRGQPFPKILFYNLWRRKPNFERKCLVRMAKVLGVKRGAAKEAYAVARRAQEFHDHARDAAAHLQLRVPNKRKVLVLSHPYNAGDAYVGRPIFQILGKLGCLPIDASAFDLAECAQHYRELSPTLPWVNNRQLVGALALYGDQVDGVILVTTFPCGPDSMVNDIIARRFKKKPLLTLTLDAQDGTAGLETRLESFVDILNFQAEANHG